MDDMDENPKVSPPGYAESATSLNVEQTEAGIQARVTGDGRVAIDLERRSSIFSSSLRKQIREQVNILNTKSSTPDPPKYNSASESRTNLAAQDQTPHWPQTSLNIVMQVVGSRGDVQPFIALGQGLQSKYNHRVRIATHPNFKSLVETNGLEFFSIGGDPHELMAFMVRSPGLLPGLDMLRGSDVAKHRKMVATMMEGCWRACIEAGNRLCDVAEVESEGKINGNEMPFVADLIVANPPSFAHVHCGQKLGVPVHIMFTMPWSATQAFPHPLANIKPLNNDPGLINYVSYALVETVLWQGLGSLQNRFRENVLGLEHIRLAFGPRMLNRLKIPHTYCWSRSLVPKPRDWGSHVSVVGFYFMDRKTEYFPDPGLAAFLKAGPVPVYVGFGSIVVDDPRALTKTVFEAIDRAGVRAVVSKGWGDLGFEQVPNKVFLIGDVPHDWLFPQVSAIVHHGGAGTTAAAIAAGKPSVIVPFFGDQFFWGDMAHKAGVSVEAIPGRHLNASSLSAAILEVLRPTVLERAEIVGRSIRRENGVEAGCATLQEQIGTQCLRCSMTPHRVAVWKVKRQGTSLSAFAATVLLNARILHLHDLELIRHLEYDLESAPWDPITGVVSSCLGMVGNMTKSLGDVPSAIDRVNKARPANGNMARKSLNVVQGTIVGTSKGVGRILVAGFRSPFEVMLMAARGFHNVPALYGDDSVRPQERIHGVVSGFEAMGKEIGYSLYDSISGLFKHPIDGARTKGLAGFGKGLAIGIGGFVLKPIAAAWGIGGYTYEGINKELERLFGSSVKAHISLARLAQGSEEYNGASNEEINNVVKAWDGRQGTWE